MASIICVLVFLFICEAPGLKSFVASFCSSSLSERAPPLSHSSFAFTGEVSCRGVTTYKLPYVIKFINLDSHRFCDKQQFFGYTQIKQPLSYILILAEQSLESNPPRSQTL